MGRLIFIAVLLAVIAEIASAQLVEVPAAKEEGDELGAMGLNFKEEEIDGGFSSLDGMLQWAIGKYFPFSFLLFCL